MATELDREAQRPQHTRKQTGQERQTIKQARSKRPKRFGESPVFLAVVPAAISSLVASVIGAAVGGYIATQAQFEHAQIERRAT